MPGMKWCCYINNWFSCLSMKSPKSFERETSFKYFLHISGSLKTPRQINPILFSHIAQPGCAVYFHMPNFNENTHKPKSLNLVRIPFNQLFSICDILADQREQNNWDENTVKRWNERVVVAYSSSLWFTGYYCNEYIIRMKTSYFVQNYFGVDQGNERFRKEVDWLNIRNISLEHFCRRLKDWSNSGYVWILSKRESRISPA